jgi:hypothetical protein
VCGGSARTLSVKAPLCNVPTPPPPCPPLARGRGGHGGPAGRLRPHLRAAAPAAATARRTPPPPAPAPPPLGRRLYLQRTGGVAICYRERCAWRRPYPAPQRGPGRPRPDRASPWARPSNSRPAQNPSSVQLGRPAMNRGGLGGPSSSSSGGRTASAQGWRAPRGSQLDSSSSTPAAKDLLRRGPSGAASGLAGPSRPPAQQQQQQPCRASAAAAVLSIGSGLPGEEPPGTLPRLQWPAPGLTPTPLVRPGPGDGGPAGAAPPAPPRHSRCPRRGGAPLLPAPPRGRRATRPGAAAARAPRRHPLTPAAPSPRAPPAPGTRPPPPPQSTERDWERTEKEKPPKLVKVRLSVHYRVHSRQMLCIGGSQVGLGGAGALGGDLLA